MLGWLRVMRNGRLGVFLLAFLLLMSLPQRVNANSGPHGDYSPTTDQCATCHRTHTNAGPGLLNSAAQENDFCFSCHNGTGAPAIPVVSTHANLDYSGGVEENFVLLCIQCHNPHGSQNLRIVRENIQVQAGAQPLYSGPVIFTARTGINSFDDGISDPASRICVTCHVNPNNQGYPMSTHEGGAEHLGGFDFSGQNCVICHPHSADNERGTADGFMATGGCVGCHSAPQDNGDGIPINGRRAVMEDFANTSHHVQNEVEDEDCRACHNVTEHGSGHLRFFNADFPEIVVTLYNHPENDPQSAAALGSICLACHDADGAAGFPPFSDGLMPQIVDTSMWQTSAHNTNGTCYDCHQNGHGSVKKALLAPWNAEPDGGLPSDSMREEEGFCYICHDEDGPATSNIQDAFFDTSQHNVSTEDQTDGSQVECVNCHNPHIASVSTPLANPDNTELPWLYGRTDFCLACHDGAPPVGVSFGVASGTGYNKLAYLGSDHALALGGYGCLHCHGAHGSNYYSLLLGQYVKGDYAPYVAANYQVCWICHDENGTIWRMNRFRNEHNRHVTSASCVICHDVHAPQDAAELGLIDFDFAVFSGYDLLYIAGYEGSLSFSIDATRNRGSCSIACHGRTHIEREYVRGSAVLPTCSGCHADDPLASIIIDPILPSLPPSVTPTVTQTGTPEISPILSPTYELEITVEVVESRTPTPTISTQTPTETAVPTVSTPTPTHAFISPKSTFTPTPTGN